MAFLFLMVLGSETKLSHTITMKKVRSFFYRVSDEFITKFNKDETTTLAASLAFYTALCLAPTLIIFVTVTSQFTFDFKNVFLEEAQRLVGVEGALALQMVIENAQQRSDLRGFAGALGILTLLISSSFVFGELRFALNRIFRCRTEEVPYVSLVHTAVLFLQERLLHVILALSFIFILAASLIISSYISSPFSGDRSTIIITVNIFISVILYGSFFTVMFLYVPFPRVPLMQAARGGILTSVLFVVGKETIAIYLGNNGMGSAYGAAGSVIFFMVWIYYSALITLCGAHLSYILSHVRQKKVS